MSTTQDDDRSVEEQIHRIIDAAEFRRLPSTVEHAEEKDSQAETVRYTSPMDGWLDSVGIEGKDEPVRVTLEERIGSRVLLRQVDPGEPTPPRVRIHVGDELIVMQAVSYMSVHRSGDAAGRSGYLFCYRVVPARREPGIVYARTLRRGEADAGQRIHVRPGETIRFEAGSIVAELGHIDAMEPPSASGYVPLAPVLWTWLTLGGRDATPPRTRYLLAAARRLDTANLLLTTVELHRRDLKQQALATPALRRAMHELIGAVEVAIVALGRVLDMVKGAADKIGTCTPVPEAIIKSAPAITAIRNAYEHIEDRALGNVHGNPDARALTIFEHDELIDRDCIVYGHHELDLATEVPELLHQARAFFIETAGDESQAPQSV
jgi:hypothetical protein